MKCVNCSSEALYEYRLTETVSQFYCGSHLPRFLEPRRKAGSLAITKHHDETVKEALAILRATPVVAPQSADDDLTEDTPKPTRKRKPKNADNS